MTSKEWFAFSLSAKARFGSLGQFAGNRNPPQDAINFSPARVTQAITVGATDISDNRASFSNFGTVLDLFAPGVNIPSSASTSDTATTTASGTSLAAPHVAGASAQLLQLDTLACPSTISQTISSNATANKIPDPGTGSPNLLLYVPPAWPTPTLYSLSLNGTSAYANIVNNSSSGVSLNIAGAITIEGWIKTSGTNSQVIIDKHNPSAGAGTNDGGYELKLASNGKPKFFVYKNAAQFTSIASSTAINNGGWHHVAGVYDGSQMRLYVDGSSKHPVQPRFPLPIKALIFGSAQSPTTPAS